MPDSIADALVFLIETFFQLYMIVVLLRILLQLTHVSFYNPVSQLVVKLTNPILLPLRRIIPAWKGIDMAAVLLLFLLQFLELFLVGLIATGSFPNIFGLFLWALLDFINLVFSFYFFLIIIAALLSWFGQLRFHPVAEVITALTEPVLTVARKVIRPIAGFDLSPIIVLICIKLIDIVLLDPLIDVAMRLTLPV